MSGSAYPSVSDTGCSTQKLVFMGVDRDFRNRTDRCVRTEPMTSSLDALGSVWSLSNCLRVASRVSKNEDAYDGGIDSIVPTHPRTLHLMHLITF